MNIKKKLKTKFDYQVRTFGICTLMIALFTFIIIRPKIKTLQSTNTVILEQIEETEEINIKLNEQLNEKIAQIKNED